jgi:hypothetical protein
LGFELGAEVLVLFRKKRFAKLLLSIIELLLQEPDLILKLSFVNGFYSLDTVQIRFKLDELSAGCEGLVLLPARKGGLGGSLGNLAEVRGGILDTSSVGSLSRAATRGE